MIYQRFLTLLTTICIGKVESLWSLSILLEFDIILSVLGRKQRVCLHGVCSSYSELRAGLPQGSLLGPPLFNIFINDLNYKVPDVSLRLYADDATLYASDVSPIALQVVVVSQGLSRLLVRCKLFVDKQFQDASPSDRSLQVRF